MQKPVVSVVGGGPAATSVALLQVRREAVGGQILYPDDTVQLGLDLILVDFR